MENDAVVETVEKDNDPIVEPAGNDTKPDAAEVDDTNNPTTDLTAEVNRLKAELLKANRKADTIAKENAEQKRRIRSLQSAEEIKAEEEKAHQEAIENELKELRKQSAVANISKRVMGFVGDESAANSIAESMYGAEDVDAVVDAIQKAWVAKEKKMKLEFGKIPAPGIGDDVPQISKAEFSKMNYLERVEYAKKYPEAYKRLTNT